MNHADTLIGLHLAASAVLAVVCILLVIEVEIIVCQAHAQDSPIAFPKLRFWRNAFLGSLSALFALMAARWAFQLESLYWLSALAKVAATISGAMAIYRLRVRRLQLILLLKQLVSAVGRG